jgi:uncharacterized repeat protein (TIGR03843 family)
MIEPVDAWLDSPRLTDALREGELQVTGRLAVASNATLLCTVPIEGDRLIQCVYKPVAGERPLWDFPDQTLGRREMAAFAVSEALGWHLVPPTAWREDGPAGPGICQAWIVESDTADVVDVCAPTDKRPDWITVLEAEDQEGNPLLLVHADRADLHRVAAFDALTNNADRKGGHVILDSHDRIWCIDHGVSFNVDDKLRTVLWGWAGEPIDTGVHADLVSLQPTLRSVLEPWLDPAEIEVTVSRLDTLIDSRVMPHPSPQWPSVPWPVF